MEARKGEAVSAIVDVAPLYSSSAQVKNGFGAPGFQFVSADTATPGTPITMRLQNG
jgi:hypothetical protein